MEDLRPNQKSSPKKGKLNATTSEGQVNIIKQTDLAITGDNITAPPDGKPLRTKATDFVAQNTNDSRRGSLSRGKTSMMRKEGDAGNALKDLKEYEMVTNMLEAKTGLKDLAEILDLYQNHEERNETLYKKLQELNDEKE
eukprot:CAMPEP_0114603148 /NCGR_PEP_ID=MMETSP0125-20121206/25596_1 /TAXON_ID=485358 ORGANISM="Aristerostoma sp., Strain ATCC 50986" /NCGR_SAMPLE_ID=MMETSP0125 /ASSEMBLY_ACC=CAM_ASM_000245 /LENGTH=139 /DNA_ID=CAMNT_0001813745 /DNA_START=517 /DNA_END=936 /DNA_ORIENTATION=-